MAKKSLVIVESPAKTRTLAKILGKEYNLKASLGHIRDLPRSALGVDVEKDFAPKYVVPRTKSKVVSELKDAVKKASTVYLATDPDREGEAISWHIMEITRADHTPYKRVVFHEITEEAIKQAFQHPRSIDMHLVDAQQARRILDRLVGYKISPLLWRKVRRGLSAGRVQSVAVRIIVDREREIEKFVPQEYWTIEAELTKATGKPSPFRALLISYYDGTRLELRNEKQAKELKDELEKANYSVLKVTKKKVTRQPPPPFITSTMQQEAWRKLHFSASQTMAIAQQLYEGLPIGDEGSVGLITYMRTDSTHVAGSAVAETRSFIEEKYGKEYLPPHARSFVRNARFSQEAHEAIRPTRIHREPSLIKKYLDRNQYRLYELIWQRMVASQMAAAIFDNTTVEIRAKRPVVKSDYLFRATSSELAFPGFTTLYTEGRDEDENGKKESPLPQLAKGDKLDLLGLFPEQHFTQPPSRYTEATLIRLLEQEGIGRPSTYATIIGTIQDREYVVKTSGSLKPTEMGFLVTDLLVQNFPDIMDIKFTAHMEDELDEIANKEKNWVKVIKEFYQPFEKDLGNAAQIERVKFAEEPTGEACPNCGKPLVVKQGRYGKFLACTGYPECKYTRSFQIKTGAKCPECGSELVQRVNKKKRTFYGCSAYPKCTFATNYKPVPAPCPQCGGLLVETRGNNARCTKCKYRTKAPEATTATKQG